MCDHLAYMTHKRSHMNRIFKKKSVVFVFASDAWYFPKFALERKPNELKPLIKNSFLFELDVRSKKNVVRFEES